MESHSTKEISFELENDFNLLVHEYEINISGYSSTLLKVFRLKSFRAVKFTLENDKDKLIVFRFLLKNLRGINNPRKIVAYALFKQLLGKDYVKKLLDEFPRKIKGGSDIISLVNDFANIPDEKYDLVFMELQKKGEEQLNKYE